LVPLTDQRPIRVLHVVPDLEFGGLQRLVVDLIERTDPSRFDVHALVFGEVSPLADRLGQSRIHRVVPQERWSLIRPARLTRQMAALGPDVVHTHSGIWYKASLAARRAGVRWVLHTDHGRESPDPVGSRIVDHLASRRTDVVAAVSSRLAEQLKATVVADPSRVRLVINGVNTALHCPGIHQNLRDALAIPAGTIVVGSIGRLEPIKGYDILVETWNELRSRLSPSQQAVLVIVGDGTERSRLERRVHDLGLGDSVRFLGWRSDVERLHATFDVFALTSRSEGTSVSLLEAMSARICPVVTNVGGNAAVLGPALAHRLVAANSPPAIAAGLLDAITDRPRRDADAAAGRARVEAQFGLDTMVRAYEQIYLEGVGGSFPRSSDGAAST
jgi:glycosyltransferase involved in cell wall biosynthesis